MARPVTGADRRLEPWRACLSPRIEVQLDALWGKSNAGGTADQPRPNLLLQHLLDSLAVGELLWDRYVAPGVRRRLDTAASGDARRFVAWLCGLHDVGKATPAFQAQVPALAARVQAAGLACSRLSRRDARDWRHDRAGGLVTRDVLEAKWTAASAHWEWVWPLVAGHHGAVPARRKLRVARGRRQDLHGAGESWQGVQAALVEVITTAAGYGDLAEAEPSDVLSRADQLFLSGLMIMADWIASDEEHFDGVARLADVSLSSARQRAEAAWQVLGLNGGWGQLPPPGRDPIGARFRMSARPTQTMVVEAARRLPAPGLLVVEAPMGEGKTEAALAAAEVLAARFGATGVFVGMPTQATSDPMFDRVLAWSQTIEPGLQVALLHGKRMFNERWERLLRRRRESRAPAGTDEYGLPLMFGNVNEDGDPGGCEPESPAEWYLGRKRGLLAHLVVGTIDQLLFAATRSRHVMLRYAGLAGKVVILDEVHAADVYMGQFLNEALVWLGQGRVPVVLLSATLAPGQRRDLVRSYQAGASSAPFLDARGLPETPGYPNVTSAWVEDGRARYDVARTSSWRSSLQASIEVLPEAPDAPTETVVTMLRRELADGGCTLLIRNTVGRAQEAFEALDAVFPGDVRLLHSRFSAADRADLTQAVLDSLGPGTTAGRPRRLIVVATQLAEQSFDIDADLVVTDLAPMDLLLQRAGRLHRHARPSEQRPARLRTPRLVVTGFRPDVDADGGAPWLPGGSVGIYGLYHLLCTAVHVMAAASGRGWSIPADVPRLVAAVYSDDPEVPGRWATVVEAARREFDSEQAQRAGTAQSLLIAVPDELPKKDLQGLHDSTSVSEDHIRVRDGDASSEVLFLRRDDRGYHSLSGTWLGPNGENAASSRDELIDVLGGTVRLPQQPAQLSAEVAQLPPLTEWLDHPWLKHAHVACLVGDRGSDLPSFTLRYDRRLGFRWERKQ